MSSTQSTHQCRPPWGKGGAGECVPSAPDREIFCASHLWERPRTFQRAATLRPWPGLQHRRGMSWRCGPRRRPPPWLDSGVRVLPHASGSKTTSSEAAPRRDAHGTQLARNTTRQAEARAPTSTFTASITKDRREGRPFSQGRRCSLGVQANPFDGSLGQQAVSHAAAARPRRCAAGTPRAPCNALDRAREGGQVASSLRPGARGSAHRPPAPALRGLAGRESPAARAAAPAVQPFPTSASCAARAAAAGGAAGAGCVIRLLAKALG